MTLKSYLWGMDIGAVFSFVAWALVVMYVDPQSSGMAGQLLFYGSLFLFLSAICIVLLTWIRKKTASAEEISFAYLGTSFRQGIMLALLAIVLLVLQSVRVLTWWDGLLTVAGIFLVELYFLTKK